MNIFITGSNGFVGKCLKKELSKNRQNKLVLQIKNKKKNNYSQGEYINLDLADKKINWDHYLKDIDIVVHLAAQAGVRYSIEQPRVYLNSNIIGSYNIIEISHKLKVKHLIMASSSSVYGANKKIPFKETDKTETQLSIYAATKKANESMAHSYSNLWKIPITMLRFFTVYGPWGRPDMALFKFTKGILLNKKIDIYNNGKMYRDFTYIDDIVNGIQLVINKAPNKNQYNKYKDDSISHIAPFRILNIGNTKKVYLLDFIKQIEKELRKKAIRNYLPLQKGDVKLTLSNTKLLKKITGYKSKTNYKLGIKKFIDWYKNYYKL